MERCEGEGEEVERVRGVRRWESGSTLYLLAACTHCSTKCTTTPITR